MPGTYFEAHLTEEENFAQLTRIYSEVIAARWPRCTAPDRLTCMRLEVDLANDGGEGQASSVRSVMPGIFLGHTTTRHGHPKTMELCDV